MPTCNYNHTSQTESAMKPKYSPYKHLFSFPTPGHASGEPQSSTTPPSSLGRCCWQRHQRFFLVIILLNLQPWKAAGFQVKMDSFARNTPGLVMSYGPWRHHSPHSFVVNHTHSCCISRFNVILNCAVRRKGGLAPALWRTWAPLFDLLPLRRPIRCWWFLFKRRGWRWGWGGSNYLKKLSEIWVINTWNPEFRVYSPNCSYRHRRNQSEAWFK